MQKFCFILSLVMMLSMSSVKAEEGQVYTVADINVDGIAFNEEQEPDLERVVLRDKEDKEITGRVVFSYPSGATMVRGNVVDGLLDGEVRYYYDNGVLWRKVNYEHGVWNGLSTEYYEDGNIHVIIPMKEGKIDGVVRSFFQESGYLEYEITYKDGVDTGHVKVYNPDGSVKVEK